MKFDCDLFCEDLPAMPPAGKPAGRYASLRLCGSKENLYFLVNP